MLSYRLHPRPLVAEEVEITPQTTKKQRLMLMLTARETRAVDPGRKTTNLSCSSLTLTTLGA
jgi:hypothetical protein